MDIFAFSICARDEVRRIAKQFQPTHLVSVVDPGVVTFCPPGVDRANHIRLFCEDESNPAHPNAPRREQVDAILSFGRRLAPEHRVLVHCHAGISRSTAAAFLLATQALGIDRAGEALARVVSVRPQAIPNLLMVDYGDELLDAGGRLVGLADQRGQQRAQELLEAARGKGPLALKLAKIKAAGRLDDHEAR